MQFALPFPTIANHPRTINNRGMKRDSLLGMEGSKLDGERISGELTRTSDRKRGTFDAKPTSRRTSKPGTPAEAAQKMRNKALRLLTTREHSREELMRKLVQAKARHAKRAEEEHDRHLAKDDIEKLVDDLAAQGWQSDERYAEAMVRRLTGQASKRFIVEKLAQAGINKEAAQLAVEAIDADDFGIAQSLWNRRYGDPPANDKERQRHIRFLLSRGFHLGDAFKIVPHSGVLNKSSE